MIEQQAAGRSTWWLALIGLILILAGAYYANRVQTDGGITVQDIRFAGTGGTEMSALLYIPKNATAVAPAPGILAVHGYINSRETQDGFAIEFARRGYVVLALDQTGHGYSGGAAFSNGFGGPDGLAYLRSLPMVDKAQIGLEGHSMGGWTILAAAAAMPNDYQSMVLEGSSTGKPFAKEGDPQWPRNLMLVFSQYDEFSKIMWDVDRAKDVASSAKLQSVFGTKAKISEGQLYGSIEGGTARILHQPATTHPGDHLSNDAIGHATDWFAKTLKGGTPRAASDQIWFGKEVGTGIGLIGLLMVILGVFDGLLRTPLFAGLRQSAKPGFIRRDAQWWRRFGLSAGVPTLLFFPVFIALYLLVPPSAVIPQLVTTQVTVWALLGAGVTWLIGRGSAEAASDWVRSLGIATLTVAVGYVLLFAVDRLFHTDLRFWIVAIKFPSARQWWIAAIYVVPLTIAFLVTVKALCNQTVRGDTMITRYGAAILSLSGGFLLVFGAVYAGFFATGYLVTSFDPLSTVIALQFIPVLAAIAIIGIFTWSRTGSHRAGALLIGMLVTLYVVAGTATQVA
ncbi:MAG: alpha/beta hydrolase family protein [Sphingomonadaceae bacterium]